MDPDIGREFAPGICRARPVKAVLTFQVTPGGDVKIQTLGSLHEAAVFSHNQVFFAYPRRMIWSQKE